MLTNLLKTVNFNNVIKLTDLFNGDKETVPVSQYHKH